MPSDLGEAFLPSYRGWYPAMLSEDQPVWDLFLTRNPTLFKTLYYNVRIGGVYPGPEYGDEKMRKVYWQTTAKRIDVLGDLGEELWLIEVGVNPGLRAVGQLQTYIALWFEDPPIKKKITPVLVCRSVDADLERSLAFYGVLLRYAV